MIDLSAILNAPILNGLTPSDLEGFGAIAHDEKAVKGDCLIAQGANAETFYIIKAGRFALTLEFEVHGAEVEIAVEEKMAGDALGWSALVAPHASIYSAYCTSDGSVTAFSGRDLVGLMTSDPGFGYRLSTNLTQLAGGRVRALQELWVSEIERTEARVDFWTETEMSARWKRAVEPGRKRRSWRHMFRRLGA
jgi:CRP-like cAMP-binding protein